MTQMPPTPPTVAGPVAGAGMRPHRGVTVLVLGILGLVVCVICGIIAWVLGNSDLRDMEAGRMDPSGMGLTKAGKICGMISVILQIVGLLVLLLLFALGIFAAAVETQSVGGGL